MATLPLPALVGLEFAQQALLLLEVEPRLRGMAVGAPAGAGKSSLARGMRDLLCSDDRSVPFVELPPGVDEAGLLGGLDIEATLCVGRQVARAGALARADGGILYADQVNLFPERRNMCRAPTQASDTYTDELERLARCSFSQWTPAAVWHCTTVVDTQRTYLSRGEARKLAEWLAGAYVSLPNAQGEQIAALAVERVDRALS